MKETDDSSDDSLEEWLSRIDRRIRRDQLKDKIRETGGLFGREENDASDDVVAFFERMDAWESGPCISNREWLARRGISFIPPAELAGVGLKRELWRLIESLAAARVFISYTNHLSDAELYEHLWTDVLSDEDADLPRSPKEGWHWDFATWGPDGVNNWLQFYASRTDRDDWQREFPDEILPPKRRPPYRRDHRLPVRE